MHGGSAGQVARAADFRLAIGELAATDPRPMRQILADAVRLGDVAMRDYEQALLHGETDAETIARLLEAARYSAGLVKLALDSGLPLDDPDGGQVVPVAAAIEQAGVAVRGAVMGMASALVSALWPLKTPADVAYQDALLRWVQDAMRAQFAGESLPDLPESPAPFVDAREAQPGRATQEPGWRFRTVGDVQDQEQDDTVPDDDPDEDLPGDAELIARVERLRLAVGVS
jgi:hypothetical protein